MEECRAQSSPARHLSLARLEDFPRKLRRGWQRLAAGTPSPAGNSQRRAQAAIPIVQSATPRAGSTRCSLEHFRQRNRARRRHILRRHFYPRRFELPELMLLVRCQKNVAKLFRATGAVMNSAEVDAANRFYTLYKPVHARDVASQDKPGSRITGVFRVIADGGCDVDEANLHVRRDCHSIKL